MINKSKYLVVIFLFMMLSCYEDNGMMQGICGPIVLPMEVYSEDVEEEVVLESVNIWNSRSVIDIFQVVNLVDDECLWNECMGLIIIDVNWPETDDALADSTLWTSNGEVVYCSIRTSPAWSPDPIILAHELGHCLGLAHDDFSDSIMYSPTRSHATPTEADIRRVLDREGGR